MPNFRLLQQYPGLRESRRRTSGVRKQMNGDKIQIRVDVFHININIWLTKFTFN